MASIKRHLRSAFGASVALMCLAACGTTRTQAPVEQLQQPMAWPERPVLTCKARVAYARQFLGMARGGLPEQRIVIADDWEPADERAEILEIRRRVYHDLEALGEVVACAGGEQT